MSMASGLARRRIHPSRATPVSSQLDRLSVVALALEVVPLVAVLVSILGHVTAHTTVGTLLDTTLLGLPIGFVLGIVAQVRLRRALPPRRGKALAITAVIVPPALFAALIVLVALALNNLELS